MTQREVRNVVVSNYLIEVSHDATETNENVEVSTEVCSTNVKHEDVAVDICVSVEENDHDPLVG